MGLSESALANLLGAVLSSRRRAWLRGQTWAPCLGYFRGKASSDDLLDSAERVEEQTQKPLDSEDPF